MERDTKVRSADMRSETRKQLDERPKGAAKAMRQRLAGSGYSEQTAMLSPRTGAASTAAADPGATAARATQARPAAVQTATQARPATNVRPDTIAQTATQAATQSSPDVAPTQAASAPAAEGAAPVLPTPPFSLTGGERPLLRQGASGDAVVELQSLLNQRDEVTQHLSVDGLFGPITSKAVRQFQAAHPPMAVDAVVGPKTWAGLDATSVEPQEQEPLAKKLFDRGVAAYDKGDYAHAYDLFTSAQEHTYRPGLVFSRAQCLRNLGGRRQDAIDLYRQYLDAGGERQNEARFYIQELQSQGAISPKKKV